MPLTPVQNASNASGVRRKRSLSFGSDAGDGHEDLKKPRIVDMDLKRTQRSPQKVCPGPRLVRSPVKQEAVKREMRDVTPEWDRGVIDLTLSDDDED